MILAVAGFVAAVLLLTGRTGATDTYLAVYDNVAGVKPGTPVHFEGYQIGQVAEVTPELTDGRPRFRVALAVRRDFPIPADSTAAIASSGLLSGAAIAIRAGDAVRRLDPGATLDTAPSQNLTQVVAGAAGTVQEIAEEGLMPLLDKLNSSAAALDELLTSTAPKVAGNLAQASATLAESSERVSSELLAPATLARIRAILDDLAAGSRTLNRKVLNETNTTRLAQTLAGLQDAAGQSGPLLAELRQATRRADGVLARLETMAGRLDTLAAEAQPKVSAALDDLRFSLDTIARRIDAISYNLESTSRNMDEFARQIRRNPGLLLRGGQPGSAE